MSESQSNETISDSVIKADIPQERLEEMQEKNYLM